MSAPNTPITTEKLAADKEAAFQELVLSSTAAMTKLAEANEIIATIPALEQKNAALQIELDNTKSKTAAWEAEKTKVATKVAVFADRLVAHGTLTTEKRAAFVATVQADPSQVVDVMEKLAGSMQVSQFGGGDSPHNEDGKGKVRGPDPIEKFANGE